MKVSILARLKQLGITIPEPPTATGNFVAGTVHGGKKWTPETGQCVK